jgi:hypothetical protein
MGELEKAISIQDSKQRIDALGGFVRIADRGKMDEEQRAIFEKSQAEILATPGYAEYYRDRILTARAQMEAEQDQAKRDDLFYRTMYKAAGGFGVLSLLPSPASVRVLGEFLADERGRYSPIPADDPAGDGEHIRWLHYVRTSNCEYAVRALNAMPLIAKPTSEHPATFEDVSAWRQWYERIKSGHATFRFEGDPTEYDLDGPAPPEKLKRLAEARERDAMRVARQQPGTGVAPGSSLATQSQSSAPNAPVSITGILLATCAVAAASVWYLVRRRKHSGGKA